MIRWGTARQLSLHAHLGRVKKSTWQHILPGQSRFHQALEAQGGLSPLQNPA